MEQKDALAELQRRTKHMLEQSKDPEYSNYLMQLLQRIQKEKIKVNSLYKEFNENYAIYMRKMDNPIGNVKNEPFKEQITQQTNGQVVNRQPVITHEKPTIQKEKVNMEYKIGAWLFSIIGVLFILTAFVILGKTYMNGLVKGLGLYLISILVLLISEFVFKKKLEKFSLAITALGTCGLYISTIVNYLYLENFNAIVAMIITVIVTFVTILLSRTKESAVIKIISFLGCYVSFFPIDGFTEDVSFLIVIVILLVVNIATIFLPVKKVQYSINILHMISNVIFASLLLNIAHQSGISFVSCILCSLSFIWILQVIFIKQVQIIEGIVDQKKKKKYQIGNISVYSVILLIQLLEFAYDVLLLKNDSPFAGLFMIGLAIMCLVVFCFQKKSNIKWIQYWALNFIVFWVYGIHSSNKMEVLISMLIMFIGAKLLSRISILKVSELIITLLAAFQGLYYYNSQDTFGIIYIIVFLASIITLYHWKSLYECIITFMLLMFVVFYLEIETLLSPICMGILMLGMFTFANVKFFRGKQNRIYNYIVLAGMILIYLIESFFGDNISLFCLLIFGITTIVVLLQKKYGFNIKQKGLVLSLFLTYMVCVFDLDLPIAKSMLLILVAIGSVVFGFILKKKGQRIYGLILALMVCLKIVFFDFSEIEVIQKMILFLGVGVIILAISGIYILLEKKANE